MNKTLGELLTGISYELLQGSLTTTIKSIAYDSRKVNKGTLFVAIPGFTSDGHNYIPQAVSSGAICVITERRINAEPGVTIILVESSREAMAVLAANFYDHPSKKCKVIGITGTNGKTTSIYILKSIYESAGHKVALIGTIGASIAGEDIQINNTTPESTDLQYLYSEMVKKKAEYCFIEVSSHALSLQRVHQTFFSGAIFTNLSPDHLEFHKDMEDYFQAKKKLFPAKGKCNIINNDDPYGRMLIRELLEKKSNVITYGIQNVSDVMASDIGYFYNKTVFTLQTPIGSKRVTCKLPGDYNLYNCLTAAAWAFADGRSLEEIVFGIEHVEGVKGRFETAYEDEELRVIIDFAHTEEGLKKVISAVREFAGGNIILVFGVYVAGSGENGQYKRYNMGKIAGEYADYVVITSDNPKDQDPVMIIDQITKGVKQETNAYQSYVDRKEAIEKAIAIASPGDVILITGKGHETSQVIGGKEVPFNEKEIVLSAIDKVKLNSGRVLNPSEG